MRKMRTVLWGSTRRKVVIGITTGLVFASAAWAAWTIIVNNAEPGRGGIATLVAPTIAYTASPPPADCYPGDTCSAYISVTNPNGPLTLTTVTFGGSPTVEKPIGTTNNLCAAATWIAPHNLTGQTIAIPSGTSDVELPGAYTLHANAPVDCQGSFVRPGAPASTAYTFSTP